MLNVKRTISLLNSSKGGKTRLRLKVLSAREYIKYIKYDKKYLIGQINLTHKSKIRVDINKEVSKIDEKMTNFQKLIKLLNIYKAGKLA